MQYLDFKNRVLMLINQYSVAGESIALSYNNQEDYISKIPGFLNSAQRYLATTTKPIYASMHLDWDAAEMRDGFYIFTMPEDFWQLVGRGLPVMKNGEFTMYHRFRWIGKDQMAIPAKDKASMEVHYHRYPVDVPNDPDDYFELDNTPEAQEAAAYYVAAYLIMHDNSFAYSALYNEFESRRQQMFERPQTEYDRVEDLYGNPGDGLYGV
jgi:hypothetical protein